MCTWYTLRPFDTRLVHTIPAVRPDTGEKVDSNLEAIIAAAAFAGFIGGGGRNIFFICILRVAVTRTVVPAIALQFYPQTGSTHNVLFFVCFCFVCLGGGED